MSASGSPVLAVGIVVGTDDDALASAVCKLPCPLSSSAFRVKEIAKRLGSCSGYIGLPFGT